MLDKTLLFLDNAAYNATPSVVDLGTSFNPGAENPVEGFISCPAGDCAGVTALVIKTGTTFGGASTTVSTIVMTAAQINTGNRKFTLPSDGLQRFVTISLTGASAGTTLTSGLGLDNQSA
jgi:hypothetical protein